MNKDIFIRLLEWGDRHSNGFTYGELVENDPLKLEQWEKAVVEKYIRNAFENYDRSRDYHSQPLLETMFFVIQPGGTDYKNDKFKYILNMESRFKYIDYISLEKAQNLSRLAIKISIVTAVFAVVTLLASIYYYQKQLTTPVSIDKNQFNSIIQKLK